MKKLTLFITLLLCFSGSANAQLFKKLGKKIEKVAEKTIERKVEQKTQKETEKAFDSTFNKTKNKKNNKKEVGISKTDPAKSYAFNYKVEMQMKSGKDVMDINYYLPTSGNFLCAEIIDKKIKDDFFTVYDLDREAMFTYMENGGHKIKMSVAFKTNETTEEDIKITATGNTKTILGYNCAEYKMTGKDMTATIWVTKDVDIRFPSTFYSMKQDRKNSQQAWMKDIDGWAIEMKMIDTSRRKPKIITIKCLAIEDSNFKINSSDYKNIGY